MPPLPSCPTTAAARRVAPGSRTLNVTRTPEHSAHMIQHLATCCILEPSAIWQLSEVAILEAPRRSPAPFRAPHCLLLVIYIHRIQCKYGGLLESASCVKTVTQCFGMSPVNLALHDDFTPVLYQLIQCTF